MTVKKILLGITLSMLLGNGLVVAADLNKGLKAYESGDFKTALAEWAPLAEQGIAEAQYNIGSMYARGLGVPRNDQAAVKWFTLAAEQGDLIAQNVLGFMYRKGNGVVSDYLRAYMWYDLGAFNGSKRATENKEWLSKKLTPAQIAKAQEMSKRCLASNYADCGGPKMTDTEQLALIQDALYSLLDDKEESLEQKETNGESVESAVHYIMDEIRQRWVRPVNAHDGMVIELVIQLIPTGEIVQVEVGYRDATATDAFITSVVKAIGKVRRFDKLSQLNPELFDANFRKFTVKFKPEDL